VGSDGPTAAIHCPFEGAGNDVIFDLQTATGTCRGPKLFNGSHERRRQALSFTSLKDQLVGTWTLVSYEDINPNGTKKQYLGANPRGILMLDAGGRYAWMQGPSDRPKLKGSRAEATAEEFHAAVGTFIASFGTWSVNEADKTLTRQIEGNLIPNVEGNGVWGRSDLSTISVNRIVS
jgi:hypothetical protein